MSNFSREVGIAKTASVGGLIAGSSLLGLGLVGMGQIFNGPNQDEQRLMSTGLGVGVGAMLLGGIGLALGKKRIGTGLKNFVDNSISSFSSGKLAHSSGRLGSGLFKGITGTVSELESHIIRPILTGKGPHSNGFKSYMPYLDNFNKFDVRRYSLNPTIGRRAVGLSALVGVGGAIHDATRSPAPPPSVIYDGTYMRHANDQGVNAHYANKILGPNSAFNGKNAMNSYLTQASI